MLSGVTTWQLSNFIQCQEVTPDPTVQVSFRVAPSTQATLKGSHYDLKGSHNYNKMKFKENLIFLWSWFKETFIHFFFKDNCPLMAAAISFYAILSLIPLFLLLISLLGFVLHSSEKASSSAYFLLVKTLPLSTATSFKLLFRLIEKRGVFGLFGILGLTWAATRIFSVIEQSLNSVYSQSFCHSHPSIPEPTTFLSTV